MTDDLAVMDATGQAELIRSGDASALELVDAAINRIEKLNPELNAVIHPRFDRARADALASTPGHGPFRGVPTLFKDLLCAMEGEPYHEGMAFLKRHDYRPDYTDYLARRFLDAGFVCCGRTNTPELGLVPTTEPRAYGATHNPWQLDRTPGGSSGGSAAAVAAGLVPVAHGNDGGGSIRIPASCCGLVGLKPSRGRSSLGPRGGHLTNFLAVEGMLTRSVRDTAAVLDVIREPFPGDTVLAPGPSRPYREEVGVGPGPLRIGLLSTNPLGTGDVHPDCVAAVEDAGRLLESLGHRVERSHPAAAVDLELLAQFGAVWSAGVSAFLDDFSALVGEPIQPDDVEPLTAALAEDGRSVTAAQYLLALQAMEQTTRQVAAWWAEGFDLLLTPTLAEPPLPLGTLDAPPDDPMFPFMRSAQFVAFTPAFNITGQPSISLPLFWSDEGLPIGSQLVAAYGREDVLIRVASQLEEARPWADRRPPVHA